MLTNSRRVYRLVDFTVERRSKGWFFARTARFDDKEEWRGPYSSLASITLMIARELKREIIKRDMPSPMDSSVGEPPQGQGRGAAPRRETPTLSASLHDAAEERLAGWPPVAGIVGRPDLRRDAVQPSQRGANY